MMTDARREKKMESWRFLRVWCFPHARGTSDRKGGSSHVKSLPSEPKHAKHAPEAFRQASIEASFHFPYPSIRRGAFTGSHLKVTRARRPAVRAGAATHQNTPPEKQPSPLNQRMEICPAQLGSIKRAQAATTLSQNTPYLSKRDSLAKAYPHVRQASTSNAIEKEGSGT